MIYLDTSSLLKLLHYERESGAVQKAVTTESEVAISTLALLEAQVQLKAGWLGGDYSRTRYHAFTAKLAEFGNIEPFRLVTLAGSVFSTAIRQDADADSLHLRSLDRLHLAAMEDLGIQQLMTNDAAQATAARALGYTVIMPA